MGALTITVQQRHVLGSVRYVTANVQFSTSYATGGDTGLTAAALGLDFIDLVLLDQPAGFNLAYNYANGQVLARRSAVHDHILHFQTAAAANAVTAAGNALRTAAAAFDVNGVVDATAEGGVVRAAQVALAEPAATTDLSTTVVSGGVTNAFRVVVIGR